MHVDKSEASKITLQLPGSCVWFTGSLNLCPRVFGTSVRTCAAFTMADWIVVEGSKGFGKS